MVCSFTTFLLQQLINFRLGTDTALSKLMTPSLSDRVVDLIKSEITEGQSITSTNVVMRFGYSEEVSDGGRARTGTQDAPPTSTDEDSTIHHPRRSIASLRLPFEMLMGIFMHAPVDPNLRVQFAASVSCVSRYWYETAMQVSFLWSGISLFGGCFYSGKSYRQFLALLIQRSNPHPLDVTVSLPIDGDNGDYLAQLAIVVPEVWRWRSFAYTGFYADRLFETTEPLIPLYAPILESFEIYFEFQDVDESDDLFLFVGGAPMLSHVHIFGIFPQACLPPLTSLTSLCLEQVTGLMTLRRFLIILRSSPALTSLSLAGGVVIAESLLRGAMRGMKVEMASLRFFKFTAVVSPKWYIECMLNVVRCPSIESMIISNLASGDAGLDDVLYNPNQSLPLHVYRALRSLELDGVDCAAFAQNFDFTQLLPVLDTISLRGFGCTSCLSLLRQSLLPSTGRPETHTIWPLLRVIKLSRLSAGDYEDLCKIILYLQECGRPLEVLEIDPHSLDTCLPDTIEWMKQRILIRQGPCEYYTPYIDWSLKLPDGFEFDDVEGVSGNGPAPTP